jgi:hypothetical protein
MKNQFWAVGRWSGLDCEIKGSGPIMSNFWGPFFHFFGVKNFFFFFVNTIACVRTEKLHRKTVKFFFFFWKIFFFRAKIWVEFECKYREVGNRLLLAILWVAVGTHSNFQTKIKEKKLLDSTRDSRRSLVYSPVVRTSYIPILGPLIYYRSKRIGGWVQKMAIFAYYQYINHAYRVYH